MRARVVRSGVRQTFSYSSGQSSTLGMAAENNVRGAGWFDSGHHLCGTNNDPPHAAQLVAR